MHFPWSRTDKSNHGGFVFLRMYKISNIYLFRWSVWSYAWGRAFNLYVSLREPEQQVWKDPHQVASFSSVGDHWSFSVFTLSCITINGKVFGPLAVNTNERFNDCHNVPIPKQEPTIYLHKATCVSVNSGAARRCPVHCVSRPLWFLSSIVSHCSFSAGVVPGPMSSFFADNEVKCFQ